MDPIDIARYWSQLRGKAEPNSEDVARELVWESIVAAQERGATVDALVVSPSERGWLAAVGPIEALVPTDWSALADPPLGPGERALRVLEYDRVAEKLTLRPSLPGEPEA